MSGYEGSDVASGFDVRRVRAEGHFPLQVGYQNDGDEKTAVKRTLRENCAWENLPGGILLLG